MRPLNLARDMGAGPPHPPETTAARRVPGTKTIRIRQSYRFTYYIPYTAILGRLLECRRRVTRTKRRLIAGPDGALSGRALARCSASALSRFCTNLLGFVLRLGRLRGSRVKKWPIMCKYREKRAYTK